jgi:hypothetical protein
VTRADVYLMPVSFGFGPAALAAAVARQLREAHPELSVAAIGDGIAIDFLRGTGLFGDAILEAEPGTVSDAITASGPSVAVFCADFDRFVASQERTDLARVVVDPLYWMWDSDPIDPALADRYLALAFPGVAERVAQRGTGSHVRLIPQVVDLHTPAPLPDRAGTVLNLGGAYAPIGDNHRYLRTLIDVVRDAIDDPDELLVTCSAVAAARIGSGNLPGVRIAEMPFDRMMLELGSRARLLTLPGQSIMWEALRMGIPTVVLPGANYSHHQQLPAYKRYFGNVTFVGWDDLDGYGTVPAGLAEAIGVARAVNLGERLAADPVARRQLADLVAAAVSSAHAAPELQAGHPWATFDGASVVASEIAALARAGA